MKNQFSGLSGKELVAAGHQFAKSLDADAPLIEIAKLFSEMASRLDCAIVRGDELQQKLDAMAAENAALKTANRIAINILNDEETMVTSLWASSVQKVEVLTPVTDAYLNSVRAEGVLMLLKSKFFQFDSHSEDVISHMATQLRSGTYDAADKVGEA
ncbi:hypothetical protein [Pantoea stewartii]|uniref:hypothetical protein n=1 Tax=Pantoea stewartii TaxID=66269 RepID=UPI0016250DDE|nr:hypothetical protein [Pantoea stewartii]MBC0852596.1 hypothetical protein [Pantoea stewartii]